MHLIPALAVLSSLCDLQGRISYANPAFVSMFEYRDSGEVLGKNAADLFIDEEIKKLCDMKAILDRAKSETERFEVVRRDSSLFIVEVSSSKVTDQNNQVVGCMASFVDITDRVRIEDENRRLEEELRNSILDGVIRLDVDSRVLELNSSAGLLFGVSISESVGLTIHELCKDKWKKLAEIIQKSLQGREAVRNREINGGPAKDRWSYIVSVIPRDSDRNAGGLVVVRDITHFEVLEQEAARGVLFEGMVGRSEVMLRVFDMVRNLSDVDTTALVQGATGTGKEMVATALHTHGSRSNGPFVRVNCSALTETLLESELFGHVKGAFTGAVADKIGRFELATGGTIFLDEVGDMSLRLQTRLLRVLQEREIERVGSTTPTPIDVRVVADTRRSLSELVSRGLFREDLYYRLKVVTIGLPLLRDRKEDIPLLVYRFLNRLQVRLNRPVHGIEPEAMEMLLYYDWPGNVRQLDNVIEHAVITSRNGYIMTRHLPVEVRRGEQMFDIPERAPSEAEKLLEVMKTVDWNRSKAARCLGISRTTLYDRMKKYGLTPPEE